MSRRNSRAAKAARRSQRQIPGILRELRRVAAQARDHNWYQPEGRLFGEYIARLLENGSEYPNGYSLPGGYPDMCFLNAQTVARERGWRYVEGVATEPAQPGYAAGWIEHAWCLDKSGRVAEVTWPHWEQRRYFGTVTPLPPPELAGVNPALREDAR